MGTCQIQVVLNDNIDNNNNNNNDIIMYIYLETNQSLLFSAMRGLGKRRQNFISDGGDYGFFFTHVSITPTPTSDRMTCNII